MRATMHRWRSTSPNPLTVEFAHLGGQFLFITVMRQVEFLEVVARTIGVDRVWPLAVHLTRAVRAGAAGG
jgi:hypothetical protein